MKNCNSKGYILLEILTAVAILALLGTMGLKLFTLTQTPGERRFETQGFYQTVGALEWFRSENGGARTESGSLIWYQDEDRRVELEWRPWLREPLLTEVSAAYYSENKGEANFSLKTLCRRGEIL